MGLGPSTKETTLHYYREPLVARLVQDAAVDFAGTMILGTSDDLARKMLSAGRAGAWAESMSLDGAFVSIDSWGNCHIDFAHVMESLGQRRIPLVGLSFVGTQAAFVVTNSYMDSIIDLNKTTEGVESEIMAQNTMIDFDAQKAVAILKNKIRKKFPERDYTVRETKELRRLIRRTYPVNDVRLAEETRLEGQTLHLKVPDLAAVAAAYPEVLSVKVQLISKAQRGTTVNSILDFAPLTAKNAGQTGEGISHELRGVSLMLTAVEDGGFQPVNIGAACGVLNDVVVFGRPGSPAPEDWIVHVDVLLVEGHGRTAEGIRAAHEVCDHVLRPLRETLSCFGSNGAHKEELWDVQRRGGMRIALIKLVPGLGCMYDTVVMPSDPSGCQGGTSVMELGNVPLVFSANELRDGALHALA